LGVAKEQKTAPPPPAAALFAVPFGDAPDCVVIQTSPNSLSLHPYMEKSGSMLASAAAKSGFTSVAGLPGVAKFMMKARCCTAKSMFASVALLCGSEFIQLPKW
jgi:hypothetical protein